jgi:hypothetical protein
MITKIQYKKADDKGIVPFTVKEDLTLEILTENLSTEGAIKTFREGGTFYGELVMCRMAIKTPDGKFKPSGQGVGLMVRNEGNTGCWLIPSAKAIPMEDNVISQPKLDPTSLEDKGMSFNEEVALIEKTPCGCNNKKILGFTYKQLAIVGGLLLIVKLIK